MDSLPPDKVCCHHTGFTKKCRKLVTDGKCNRWIMVQGTHPQTGDPLNPWDCIDNWTPVIAMENARTQRSTAAAIESFRNEVVARNDLPPLPTLPRGEDLMKTIRSDAGGPQTPALEHRDGRDDQQS